VQIIAIGAPEDVLQLMHRCGLEIPMCSPPQPIPDTEEIVRVYVLNRAQPLQLQSRKYLSIYTRH
jgi:hypothetical protein